MKDTKMNKEQEEYTEMTVSLAQAAHGQIKNVSAKLDIGYSDAAALFSIVTSDKLVYLLTQHLSSDGSRSAAPEENKQDTP
jgi:hypothetical protein